MSLLPSLANKMPKQTVLLARPGMLENGQSSLFFNEICFFNELQNTILSICNISTEIKTHNSENPIKSVIFTKIVWYFLFKGTMWEKYCYFCSVRCIRTIDICEIIWKLANKVRFTNSDQYEILHSLSETRLFNVIGDLFLILIKLNLM